MILAGCGGQVTLPDEPDEKPYFAMTPPEGSLVVQDNVILTRVATGVFDLNPRSTFSEDVVVYYLMASEEGELLIDEVRTVNNPGLNGVDEIFASNITQNEYLPYCGQELEMGMLLNPSPELIDGFDIDVDYDGSDYVEEMDSFQTDLIKEYDETFELVCGEDEPGDGDDLASNCDAGSDFTCEQVEDSRVIPNEGLTLQYQVTNNFGQTLEDYNINQVNYYNLNHSVNCLATKNSYFSEGGDTLSDSPARNGETIYVECPGITENDLGGQTEYTLSGEALLQGGSAATPIEVDFSTTLQTDQNVEFCGWSGSEGTAPFRCMETQQTFTEEGTPLVEGVFRSTIRENINQMSVSQFGWQDLGGDESESCRLETELAGFTGSSWAPVSENNTVGYGDEFRIICGDEDPLMDTGYSEDDLLEYFYHVDSHVPNGGYMASIQTQTAQIAGHVR